MKTNSKFEFFKKNSFELRIYVFISPGVYLHAPETIFWWFYKILKIHQNRKKFLYFSEFFQKNLGFFFFKQSLIKFNLNITDRRNLFRDIKNFLAVVRNIHDMFLKFGGIWLFRFRDLASKIFWIFWKMWILSILDYKIWNFWKKNRNSICKLNFILSLQNLKFFKRWF